MKVTVKAQCRRSRFFVTLLQLQGAEKPYRKISRRLGASLQRAGTSAGVAAAEAGHQRLPVEVAPDEDQSVEAGLARPPRAVCV